MKLPRQQVSVSRFSSPRHSSNISGISPAAADKAGCEAACRLNPPGSQALYRCLSSCDNIQRNPVT